MAVICPMDSVPYFCDHDFFQDKSAQLQDKAVRMRIEAPMRVSAREAGIMMNPKDTKNDCFCCKKIALQNLGVVKLLPLPQPKLRARTHEKIQTPREPPD
jgi:hypothetical protein